MGEAKVWNHKVSLTFYRLTSLSFQVNQPSHSWDTTFSKLVLENPRSWKRSILKVTSWVQHSIDSHPFRSMSISHSIHKIHTTFLKFNLENPRSKSWVRRTLKVTTWVQHSIDSHPFNSMSIDRPILEIRLFQNLTLKIQGQCHGLGHSWKSQSGLTSYRLTSLSFHVNRPSHSWDTAFSKFDLENPRSRSWVRETLKVT